MKAEYKVYQDGPFLKVDNNTEFLLHLNLGEQLFLTCDPRCFMIYDCRQLPGVNISNLQVKLTKVELSDS